MLLFESILALFEPTFLVSMLVLGFFEIAAHFLTAAKQFVFGLEFGLLEDILGVFLGLADDLAGASFGDRLAVLILLTEEREARPAAADQAYDEA